VDNISEQKALHSDIVDYLELSLYSAAEHIDDIGSLANCFFPTQRHTKKSKRLRDLRRSMKPIRDRLSGFANALKHNQSRIRIYSMEFFHDGESICLHGLYIQSFAAGKIGPCPILHSSDEQVISVTW
jgi:hypothetical protein